MKQTIFKDTEAKEPKLSLLDKYGNKLIINHLLIHITEIEVTNSYGESGYIYLDKSLALKLVKYLTNQHIKL